MNMKKMFDSYKDKSLIMRIIVGLVLGAILGVIAQGASSSFMNALVGFAGLLGNLFVGALKAVAPILVFILILSAIINKEFSSGATGLKKVVVLYIVGTLLASATGVAFSFMFPTELALSGIEGADRPAPVSVLVVLKDLLFKIVDNPLNAIVTGNYIGIIAWAVGLGVTLRYAKGETKKFFGDISEALTKIVQFIIQLAPFGIFGLVATTVYETGLQALAGYARIVVVLVAAMAFVALVINPLIVFVMTKKNPYPLVLTCLKESGITAFFTRSSAANIPVNLNLCKKLGINEELYSISIPLGATINMGGAAVVIAIMALAAANTLGITPDFGTALLLCVVGALGACGASGVPGGSLLLIPLACGLFGISNDIAMQVVAIGFIIGVIQDSVETAINSSTDVVFSAVASGVSEPNLEK